MLTLSLFLCLSPVWAFDCPEMTGLFPSPGSDCAQFYKCSNGQPHLYSCPQGLSFNRAGYCDWPDNVDCQQTTGTSTTISTHTTTWSEWPDSSSSTTPTSTQQPTTTAWSEWPGSSTSSSPTPGESDWECRYEAEEPVSAAVRERRSLTCVLSSDQVDKVSAGTDDNPTNVQILQRILPQQTFQEIFPRANPAYTYDNFLKAVGAFPAVCRSEDSCRRELAAMFAHFQQETLGLFYLEEINKSPYCAQWTAWVTQSFPCSPGRKYYGRGAKQLSWNYNYGAFSLAIFGDAEVLLRQPELVATTWLNFASAVWFFVTPQPPKPAMLEILTGAWRPTQADLSGNILPGFGATTLVINGALECGPSPANPSASTNRQHYYRLYADMFGLDISQEKLDCADMAQFSSAGAASPALYWEPGQACSLVTWQTAFSALVDGNYQRCLRSTP